MNPDPVPPVRPLLTHMIADGPLRHEAGISIHKISKPVQFAPELKIPIGTPFSFASPMLNNAKNSLCFISV